MSLSDLFKQEEGFNPAEDALQDDGLPEGDYLVIVENISHYVNKETRNESFRMSLKSWKAKRLVYLNQRS
ncbi:hypothetical protein WS105_0645 [Weissella ceti]|uniref:hypothetical protein n=1 Tax=Weissella ceti TaxID=759620 RepID=UPI0004F73C6A|nr:hypothetical protein [Weissella ceti]AIM64235.1 hypothetical protein WS105_0645 [Weissella ceti]